MKSLLGIIVIALLIVVGISLVRKDRAPEQAIENGSKIVTSGNLPSITPISHATMVLGWADTVIFTDPVGGRDAFAGQPTPTLILVTDIHGDHLDVATLEALATSSTIIVAPQAVADELSENLLAITKVLANGQQITEQGISILAIPMYNLPESADSRHVKGRGNGYLLERNGVRVYVAGDTADIPEMRALTNIDIAFVPMNLPFTMDVETAANAVLDFKPKQVYPFHYRGQEGLSDTTKFRSLVNAADPNIEVILLDWYPE